ncbi:hypothetical protein [Ralstonia pickettii]|uniref:hypothetical protein n=1 Tax=Ralstonia pickettii TaxID=329 RepID=UPI0015BE99DF|nr:hypothetical protein [Ralstonia pickettii]NWK46425.1 hypothetical protein [Ralstonia pickettii]
MGTQKAKNAKPRVRDDFKAPQKTELAKRVNYRCSLCDAQTLAPKRGSDQAFGVGKAAHIKAAAPGGPRYDPNQTPEERSSIRNGIWVCANCSDEIDRDEESFPVEELLRRKATAEQLARDRLGKRPQATPLVARTSAEISEAVRLFCSREAAIAEALDPRFSVSVTFENNAPVYRLQAREPVPGRIAIAARDSKRFAQGVREFQDYGGTLIFDDIELSIEGSPLFPSDETACQRLQLSTESRTTTLTLVLDAESDSQLFIEFAGSSSHGAKGVRFEGLAWGGLARATLTSDFQSRESTFSLSIDVAHWARKPVLRLSSFAKLRRLVQAVVSSSKVSVSLETDGGEVELGVGTIPGNEFFRAFEVFLYEVDVLRQLDTFFGLGLVMPEDLDDILRDRGNIVGLLSLIGLPDSADSEVEMTYVSNSSASNDDGFLEMTNIIEQQRSADLRIRQQVGMRILGRAYGPFTVEVSCAQTLVTVVGPASFLRGKPARLSLRPAQEGRWSVQNLGPSNLVAGSSIC